MALRLVVLSGALLVTVTHGAAVEHLHPSIRQMGAPPPSTPVSDTCLNRTQYNGINPTTVGDFYDCFKRVANEDGTATLYWSNVPNHLASPDSNNTNPLCLFPQKVTLPKPVKTAKNTRPYQLGPIAISTNGVAMYGANEGTDENAVSGAAAFSVPCYGHPVREGIWHYHTPDMGCVTASSTTLVGWALDGFPIYGALDGTKNVVDAILDECNGRDVTGDEYGLGYQYHVRKRSQLDETPTTNLGANNVDNWKYFIGCYKGTPVTQDKLTNSTTTCAKDDSPTVTIANSSMTTNATTNSNDSYCNH